MNRYVLTPQYFGSLMFDRQSSRYLPFDHEATELLRSIAQFGIGETVGRTSPDDRDAVLSFIDCYSNRGFFKLNGRLDATLLDAQVPDDHLVGPLATHVEVIGACNLTCHHCFAGELPRNHNPLQLHELDRLFGDLARLGSFRLGLTGGEPLLRKDIFEVLDSATSHGLHPCITTNATMIDERVARELGRRSLVWLNVSLEGPTAEVNDPVRGAGTFDMVLDKLAVLKQHARFTLAFTLTGSNAHLAPQCAELARQVGANTAVFRPMYPAGTGRHHLDLMPTFRQYTSALDDLSQMSVEDQDLRSIDPFGPETRASTQPEVHTSQGCGAGRHVCSVSVQGDVNPCSFLGPSFNSGNIREQPFPQIWRHSQQFRHMREESPGFRGGCRARSLVFNGSVDAPDPWYDQFSGDDGSGCLHPGANVEHRLSLPLV